MVIKALTARFEVENGMASCTSCEVNALSGAEYVLTRPNMCTGNAKSPYMGDPFRFAKETSAINSRIATARSTRSASTLAPERLKIFRIVCGRLSAVSTSHWNQPAASSTSEQAIDFASVPALQDSDTTAWKTRGMSSKQGNA